MENKTISDELVILSKQTIDLFLKEPNCVDIIAVYTFYYYTAKWQQTNQIKAVDKYVMTGLHMGNVSFKKAKAFLVDNNLIDSVPRRDSSGKIKGWYIKINYIWSSQKVQNEVKIPDPEVLKPTSGEKETNALSADSINALNADIIADAIPSTEQTSEQTPIESTPVPSPEPIQEPVQTELPGQLPLNRGKTPIQRVTSIYHTLFRSKYGFAPTLKMAAVGTCIDELLKTKTEFQIAALMISFFEWRGMTGDSDFDEKKLINATHPFTWFYSTVNQHETYLRNVQRIDFDSDREVGKFVYTYMINLKK